MQPLLDTLLVELVVIVGAAATREVRLAQCIVADDTRVYIKTGCQQIRHLGQVLPEYALNLERIYWQPKSQPLYCNIEACGVDICEIHICNAMGEIHDGP